MQTESSWIQRMRRCWSLRKHRHEQSKHGKQGQAGPSSDAASVESLPAYTVKTFGESDIYAGSGYDASLNNVRIVRVGRDVSETRRWYQSNTDISTANAGAGGVLRGYSYYYENDPLLYTDEKRDIPDNAVPYLDDCDYEQLAAQIARQQSLLRRHLHRMSLMLSRRPAEMF
ncbi:hypothetical protein GGI15_003751 [Coemansia interrupta]|uniref:Uncharacterized protein n=1 Tax=Coemansia interrupta TaxID=1126814 RepID=A0A9W8HE83_9FUNG|nr:hypothetical protein GGI15_003751 [Coemansia interrupta]